MFTDKTYSIYCTLELEDWLRVNSHQALDSGDSLDVL